LKSRRYFYVGERHGVQIFEPYNLVTNAPGTYLNQRLIWQESDFDFEQLRINYGIAVRTHPTVEQVIQSDMALTAKDRDTLLDLYRWLRERSSISPYASPR
jgi:hypothetical protein